MSLIDKAIHGEGYGPFDTKFLLEALENGELPNNNHGDDGDKTTFYCILNNVKNLSSGEEKLDEENLKIFFKILFDKGMTLPKNSGETIDGVKDAVEMAKIYNVPASVIEVIKDHFEDSKKVTKMVQAIEKRNPEPRETKTSFSKKILDERKNNDNDLSR